MVQNSKMQGINTQWRKKKEEWKGRVEKREMIRQKERCSNELEKKKAKSG